MDWLLILRFVSIAMLVAGGIAMFCPVPLLARRWKAGSIIALSLIMLSLSWVWPKPGWCGCQPAPIPNIVLLDVGRNLMKQGHYAAAKSAFDDLIQDWKSSEIRPAAIYGRALSEQKLGEIAAAQKDFATAATFKPSGAVQFKEFGS
jgi:hypothetical protein